MTAMKMNIASIILALSLFNSLAGQDISVKTGIDTSRIYIGDQIRFSIKVEQPSGISLSIPSFQDTLIKNIEIISGPVTDSIQDQDGNLKINIEYLITSFDSGYYQIPPAFAELKSTDGLKRFYSDYLYLEVIRPDIAPADSAASIFDIIKPYKAPVTLGEIIPWLLLLLLVIFALYFGYKYLIKRGKKDANTEAVKLKDPAHIIALRELELLKDEKLWQKGEIKIYYSRLTEILRRYLENRYEVYSMEMTTSETIDALQNIGFRQDKELDNLKSVLNGADMVKFAKYNPEPSENEYFYETAWQFVIATKYEDSPASEAQNEKMEGGES